MSSTTLKEWQPLRTWVESGAGAPAFATYAAINWFIRFHREELIASQTFLPGRGARASLVSPQFGDVCALILAREARKGLDGAARVG